MKLQEAIEQTNITGYDNKYIKVGDEMLDLKEALSLCESLSDVQNDLIRAITCLDLKDK